MKEKRQQGVALVVTLILLSVITFLAVTFLVLSRRGAEQVATLTAQNQSRQLADEAVNKGIVQIMARFQTAGNGFAMPLIVSTNFMSTGFVGNSTAINNVAYNYANGQPLNIKDQMQMLNNLLVLPRPPVFINLGNGLQEFRFYLDLNRNGMFDTNGMVAERNELGQLVFNPTNAALVLSNFHIGDLEWVGVLDHPDQRHSPSNFFVGRYAFICLPAGNALDANFIHNEAKQIGKGIEGYLRNEGVGAWENNLAAFLYTLNPRHNGSGQWEYLAYDTNTQANANFASSQGSAFDDANSLLQYRYNGNYNTLTAFRTLYQGGAPNAPLAFASDGIDSYTVGPLMNGLNLPGDNDGAWTTRPWSGANNSNQYFSHSDFFGSPTNLANFTARLNAAGTNFGTTNEYTFYRMLEQLATDGGRDSGKLNLNYANRNGLSATNFTAWKPVQFFTNAANALLAAHPDLAGSDIRSIQIYPNNEYTPALHQLLQMAANIYDATVYKASNAAPDDFDYPSVFRPVFRVDAGKIYINDFIEVGPQTGAGNASATNNDYAMPPFSLPDDIALVQSNLNAGTNINIYGVPWIIGARKGLPNFNEVSMQSVSQITRKMQIDKGTVGAARTSWHTNVQYTLGISNYVAVESWNSYSNVYVRPCQMIAADNTTLTLTNELGVVLTTNMLSGIPPTMISNWAGFTPFSSNSFILPVFTNISFIPGRVYKQDGTLTKSTTFETTTGFPQPTFGFNVTNRLRFILLDYASGRVIDYVQLDGMDRHRKLMDEVQGTDTWGPGGVWDTNRVNDSTSTGVPAWGMLNQIQVSQNNPPYSSPDYPTPVYSNDWASANVQAQGFSSVADAVSKFRDFNSSTTTNPSLSMQVPFTPTRTVSRYYTWQANDPLVHYTLNDLSSGGPLSPPDQEPQYWDYGATTNQVLPNVRKVNNRYLPWDGHGNPNAESEDVKAYASDMTLKDPMVFGSDDWQFPTNKFPNIGWLGRVHRGTPWQTIYMKPGGVDGDNWKNWTGDGDDNDSRAMRPTNDWGMFDLFTTSPNDNATRGQLSINQTNMAAWAALFSGVIVNSNDAAMSPVVINPVPDPNLASNNPVNILVRGINKKRDDFPGNVFTRVGDILSVPELTVNSPFLDPSVTNVDALYERLPQQVMSLLKVGKARYVIYSFGQAVRPAPNSIFTGRAGISAQFTGMCTNYQIVGEVVTRTVVRFEPSEALKDNSFTRRNPTRNPIMPGQGFGNGNNEQPTPRAVIESFTVLGPD